MQPMPLPTPPRAATRCSRIALSVAVAALASLASLATATAAQAETYDVHSCHLPSGEAASIDGWFSQTSGSFTSAFSDCTNDSRGSLFVSLSNTVNHNGGDQAGWRFSAPADVRIVEVEVGRRVNAGTSQSFGTPIYQLLADSTVLEQCSQFGGCSGLDGTFRADVNSAQTLAFTATCSGQNGCPARSEPKIDAAFARTRIRLRDDLSPAVTDVGGPLASAQTVSGTVGMTFNASDRGSGVYQARVFVDDQLANEQLIDDNGNRCRKPFTHAVPCKPATTGNASLDTTPYADGRTLTVRVEVTDAAGNRTNALPPRQVVVDNVPACSRQAARDAGFFLGDMPCNPALRKASNDLNGSAATQDARLQSYFSRQVKTRCKSRRAHRAGRRCARTAATTVTRADAGERAMVRGRLITSAGQSIGGATLWFAKAVEGATPRMIGPITTRPDGRFAERLPDRQPSGMVRLYYFPSSGGNEHVVSNDLRLRVRAGVFLSAKRTSSRRVRFRGHVLTASAGNGIAIGLQVRERGKWRTFRQVRAKGTPRAIFAAAYRFIGRPSAKRYRFRAVVIRQAGLAFDSGSSGSETVRLRR